MAFFLFQPPGMHPSLQQNQFFVKEHLGILKAANNFDIHDPVSQQLVLTCREPHLGFLTKLLRFTDYKRMTPFEVEIRTPEGQKVLTVRRGVSFILSTVDVMDEHDQVVGHFSEKLFSIGGSFDVLDTQRQVICTLKGKWTSWDFRFVRGERELARVTKKWSGVGKELFTSADNYMLVIDPSVAARDPARLLMLAAVMCIDMVLKE